MILGFLFVFLKVRKKMKLVGKEVGETWEKPGEEKEYKQNLLYEKNLKPINIK